MKDVAGDVAVSFHPRDAAHPAYRRLYAALRDAILDGRLRPGVKLPATRDLARRYGLARGTVVSAFEQLQAEGYLASRVGSGTFVCEVVPDALLQAGSERRTRQLAGLPRPRRLSTVARLAVGFMPSTAPAARAFRPNQPALDLFPTTLWAQVAGRRLRRASTALLKGCPPAGYPPLQEALAHYLGAARGVVCTPQQIVIVSGVQEAIDLVIRMVLNAGDRVCIENPGYVGAARALAACGASMSYVPLDREGMTVPTRARGIRLAYVTPAHQYPMGTTMSLARRLALLDWARRTGALIFEDDYDSEFRFAGAPVPALQGLDRHGSVLFAGSFSKVLFPALRIGYLVVPADLVDRVQTIKSLVNRYTSVIDQAVLCDFMTEGHLARHIRRMREVYAARLAALLRAGAEHLGSVAEFSAVEAGLQTAVTFRSNFDATVVAAAAARRGVEVVPLSRYSNGPLRHDGLLLGFAAVDAVEIQRGVKELASVLKTVGARPLRARRPGASRS
jgi:GntR family transcriptional regulator / MocR family aminotransferase